jgi:hypothetical protein
MQKATTKRPAFEMQNITDMIGNPENFIPPTDDEIGSLSEKLNKLIAIISLIAIKDFIVHPGQIAS